MKNIISNEEVNQLPLREYEGEIEMIEDPARLKSVFEEINNEDFVGIDTETKPVFVRGERNKVALLQVATSKKVYLLRISKLGITPEIKEFFEKREVQKIGVALHDDLIELQEIVKFSPEGFIDLQNIAKQMGIVNRGLRKLGALILGFRISKGAQVSNWEAEELSSKQMRYAATDAWVCRELYLHFYESKKK